MMTKMMTKMMKVSVQHLTVSSDSFSPLICRGQGPVQCLDQCLIFLSRFRSERWHEVKSKKHNTNIKECFLGES